MRGRVTRTGYGPSQRAINIGGEHFYERLEYKGQWVAIHDYHKDKEGEWCVGYVPFDVASEIRTGGDHWTIESWDPLTLSPSLLCRTCGNHGFIRRGVWVPA